MSNRPRSVPSYRRHKQSGQAIVTLPDGLGSGRRDVLLGRHGTQESRVAYARVIAEWEARGRRLPATPAGPDLTVNELLVRFLLHAERHYRRPDGTRTSEVREFKCAFGPLMDLYGHTQAADFGPLALKAVRSVMVGADLCRNTVNARVARIKRTFKWAAAEELVPATVCVGLAAVAGLAKGRTAVRETDPVRSVPDAFVDAVLAHVLPPVRAMIELQRVTGMRPGEVCAMRPCDIDMTGAVWLYRPPQHKTAWRGKSRIVCLGPRAQPIIREFLTLDTRANLFNPRRAMEDRAAGLRADRKTPVQPSQMSRRVACPEKRPGAAYGPGSYSRAVADGCDKADLALRQAAEDNLAEGEGRQPASVPVHMPEQDRLVPRWRPNQLRHNYATEVRRRFGLEASQVVLGHSRADVTQIYAERDLAKAVEVARQIG